MIDNHQMIDIIVDHIFFIKINPKHQPEKNDRSSAKAQLEDVRSFVASAGPNRWSTVTTVSMEW